MNFSLIICTFMRPKAIITLLDSVKKQKLYPSEIIIVDGSTNDDTKFAINKNVYKKLSYYKVSEEDRGLTKQRNFGISKVAETTEVVCFLDDDTVLTEMYFKNLIETYKEYPNATGVGGIAINENRWELKTKQTKSNKYYQFENYIIKVSQRDVIRNIFCLESNQLPGIMPNFSHGKTFGYPLNGKTYKVDLLIGLSFSFHKKVFKSINFSTYFEGYGLYEDSDYSLRALNFGDNLINTKAQLYHYHNSEGRPNKYKYGKMVVRNGWYVWRVKYTNPSIKSRFKWCATTCLLMFIRFTNVFTTSSRKEAFTEAIGRFYGLLTLIFNKPKVKR